jgi:hypothetical protein
MNPIEQFIRQHLLPCAVRLSAREEQPFGPRTVAEAGTWHAPFGGAALQRRELETMAADLRAMWASQPELLSLVDPLVSLCAELGTAEAVAADIDGSRYVLF